VTQHANITAAALKYKARLTLQTSPLSPPSDFVHLKKTTKTSFSWLKSLSFR
jgi:hypothetical protein